MYTEEIGQKEYSDTNYADRAVKQEGRGEGSVAREYGNLQKTIDVLRANLGELDDRLQPILRNEPPMVDRGATANSRELPACSLAQSISGNASSLEALNEKLTNIIRRIEL